MGNELVYHMVDYEQEKKEEQDKALDHTQLMKSKLAHI